MFTRLTTAAALVLAIAAAGCSGSDGAQGPQGVAGQNGQNGQNGQDGGTGPAGPTGPTGPTGSSAQAGTSDDVLVSNALVTVVGSTATMTFNVKVLGVNRNDFTQKSAVYRSHNEDAFWYYDTNTQAGARTKLVTASWSFVANGNGNYTATIPALPTAAVQPGTAFMISVVGPDGVTATPVAYVGGTRSHDVVGSEACLACHGSRIFRGAKASGDHLVCNPYGVEACIVCHNRSGSADPRLPGAGSGLMGIVHGIHNSKNMAAGMNVDIDPSLAATVRNANAANTFTWTWASNGNKFNFSVGYPTYMQNCSVCHDTPARLAAVMTAAKAQVGWGLCMSCHNDWNGFTGTKVGGAQASHRAYDLATNCAQCHNGTIAAATISHFHDGLKTERDAVVIGGADQSLVLGERFRIGVKSVSLADGGVNTKVVWNVVDPVGVTTYAPCNQSFASGPVFFGWTSALDEHGCTYTAQGCTSNFRLVRAFATGDDWVANTATTAPGQPDAVAIGTTNTTCAGFDATTTVSTLPGTPSRALLAIEGKAQLDYDPSAAVTLLVWARSPSPVYAYDATTGAPLSPRRQVVSTAKCLACHPGSLYQHGGGRVDQVELCDMCHNPASNDKNNRVSFGVTATEAYDGKLGQTYDMRTMIHAIHAAGESSVPWVVYRTRGIYAFGNAESIAAITASKDWPGPITTTVRGSTKVLGHNEILVHYPRKLSACSACHVGGSELLVDPAKAVAVTDEDAGAASADPAIGWSGQLDDVLVGPTTQACLSCHLGSNGKTSFEQAQLKAHTQQFSWQWAAFPGGRADLLDGAPIETCFVCHDVSKHR